MNIGKQKLYFIFKDTDEASSAVALLEEELGGTEHIGVICEDANLKLESLPQASIDERSDLANALKRGASIGGVAGALAGLTAIAFPPSGVVLGGAALLGLSVAGSTFGAWAASLIGVSEDHPLVEEFQTRLSKGEAIVLVDVDDEAVKSTLDRVSSKFNLLGETAGKVSEATQ